MRILTVPDPRLRTVAAAVDLSPAGVAASGWNRARLSECVLQMTEALYHYEGAGLAAPQLGVPLRVILVDVEACRGERSKRRPLRMLNPEITWHSPETTIATEGCLSAPGQMGRVSRSARIRFTYRDLDWGLREMEADGLFARCVQHECDHLEGKLFLDRLEPPANPGITP